MIGPDLSGNADPTLGSATGFTPLSACLIAFNEQDRIADCIRSASWCDEVVVIDSHSSDRTREIARQLGARVIERDWPGFGEQKRFAVESARNDWVLFLDADERVSPELRSAIERLRDRGFADARGWTVRRLNWYLGRPIRHGSLGPDRILRLFDRRHSRWVGDPPHETPAVDGPTGRLEAPLLHDPYRDLADHLGRMDRYTTIMAEGMNARGRRARALDLVIRPGWRFVRSYLLRGGFLDGWRGLVLAYLDAHYVRLKYTKLLVMQRAAKTEPTVD